MLEVIAGVVLAQVLQTVPDLAVRQHRLQSQHQVARGPIAQHLGAAGVGRDHPAHRGRAFRGETQRKAPAHLGGRGMHLRKRHAGLGGQGVVIGVDLADRPHPLGGEQDLALRDLAAHKAGVAALDGDRLARLETDADHGGDLVGGLRQGQERRGPDPAVAPFHQLRRDALGIFAPAALAQHRLQARKHVGGNGGGHGFNLVPAA
jgi:hypothetical protein